MALRYAEIVRDDMSARDPDNADYYAANYDAFAALIDELDAAMRESFATVPVRKLLTYHDAYAYFAEEYDWDVIGAIQVSDFEDPTPREVAELIEQVEAEGVPAIFGSEVFPSPVLEQIGREAGRRVRRRAARRRPAGRAGRRRALVARVDAVRLHHDGHGARRRRLGAGGRRGPQRRPGRGDVPAVITAADSPELVRVERVSCAVRRLAGARRHQPAHRRRPVHRDRRTVGLGQDDAAANAARHGSRRAPARSIALPGLRVGYVPQVETVDWNFPVTVSECVLMARTGGRVWPWRSRAERAEVDDVLERLEIAGLADRHIRQLSGGQQQRVFVARALLSRPQLLLMDEPTSGVDFRTRHEILHLLGDLYGDGLAIVLTTHDLNGIAAHLPHLVCLNTEIIGSGPPRTVLTPDILERTFGAPIDVLEHAGMPVVVDSHRHVGAEVIPLRRESA